MDLDRFLLATFCLVDDILSDILSHRRLRQRGPAPKLADSEVITMAIVGAYLSLPQDQALCAYFRRHYRHVFPAIGPLHRTTFVRQAANLCPRKERSGHHLLAPIRCDPSRHLVDSLPLPVGPFARASRCPRFRGAGTFGYDLRLRQTGYGFRVPVLVAGPGVMVRFRLAPAQVPETAVVPEWVHGPRARAWGTATTGVLGSQRSWRRRACSWPSMIPGLDAARSSAASGIGATRCAVHAWTAASSSACGPETCGLGAIGSSARCSATRSPSG